MPLKKASGATTIEFALLAILLFSLLFLIIELGLMFYVNLTIQHAVREGTRYAITGQADLHPDGRRASVVQKVKDNSIGLCDKHPCAVTFYKLDPDNSPVEIIHDSEEPKISDVGEPAEIIIVTVDYTWPLLTPLLKPFFSDGEYRFTARATMRNEPFPES